MSIESISVASDGLQQFFKETQIKYRMILGSASAAYWSGQLPANEEKKLMKNQQRRISEKCCYITSPVISLAT